MTYEYLDPREGPVESSHSMSERPRSLDGLRLGVLVNGKPNSRELLGKLTGLLSKHQAGISIETLTKPSPFKPAPSEVLNDVQEFDALITGIGD